MKHKIIDFLIIMAAVSGACWIYSLDFTPDERVETALRNILDDREYDWLKTYAGNVDNQADEHIRSYSIENRKRINASHQREIVLLSFITLILPVGSLLWGNLYRNFYADHSGSPAGGAQNNAIRTMVNKKHFNNMMIVWLVGTMIVPWYVDYVGRSPTIERIDTILAILSSNKDFLHNPK